MPAPVRDIVSHVWKKLDRSGRCWLWTGARHPFGYGEISIQRQRHRLHRLLYEWTWGPIPDGMVVMHACDTPACCKPSHLGLGTPKANVHDAIGKGRFDPGAVFRNRVACKRGHPFDAENTLFDTDGYRKCRECSNAPRRRGIRGTYKRKQFAA